MGQLNGIWLAVVASISAAITSTIAPILLGYFTYRQRRQEKRDEYERTDAVAEKAEEVAQQAAEAARLLIESNKEVADIAREVALVTAEATAKTDQKLEVLDQGQKEIHTLVNSSMTAAMQGELLATSGQYAMMVEVIDLKKTQGHQPTVEALAALETTRARVADLTTQLEDRRLAQIKADEEKAQMADQGKVEVVVQGRMP